MNLSSKSVASAIIILGINSIVAQIIIIRELLVVFYGNEISVGLILGIWLLLGGLGSGLLGRLSDKIAKKFSAFILGELFLGVFIFLSLFLIRGIKPFFNLLPGEIMPFSLMITSSFVALAPICLLLGFLFTLGCHLLKTHETEGIAQIGYVYALEAVGAALGGIFCNLLLIKIFTSFNILVFLFIINLLILFVLVKHAEISKKLLYILKIFIVVILLLLIYSKLMSGLDALDNWAKRIEWKGFNLVENKNSIYSNLSVIKQDGLYSFFSNGILMFTMPDLLAQEENTHFAMLQRPDAKTVLLIGGSSGALWEILKYNVDKVDYVELDPMIITLVKKYLKSTEFYSLDAPQVKIINTDGRSFMQKTQNRYDVIILNLPDPFTAQLNRFYTLEFFEVVKRRLNDRGVFYFGLTSSENYISKELEAFLGTIYSTLKVVFTDIKIIPGDSVYFVASPEPESLTLDSNELTKRLRQKDIQTKFVREYYLFNKLSQERLSYISERLKNTPNLNVNRDFLPISYYYDMILWSSYFKNNVKSFFEYINKKVIYMAAAILYVLIILGGLFGKGMARAKRSSLIAVATTGFSEISFEIIVVIAFQILYGYLYYKLGIIITSFMVGLSAGGFLMARKINSIKEPYNEFIKIQIAICIYPLILPVIFYILHTTGFYNLKVFGSGFIFTALPILAGLMGGLQFPLANKIYLEKKERLGRVAGLNYAADMVGSCIGAILISAFIIPIVGIYMACTLVSLLNISSLLSLILNKRNYRFSLHIE